MSRLVEIQEGPFYTGQYRNLFNEIGKQMKKLQQEFSEIGTIYLMEMRIQESTIPLAMI
jgi:hypothetical protein